MNIFVGNLSRDANENALRQVFEEVGQVSSVAIIKDKFTGNPRGFGFVEMPNKDEATAAIGALNGKDFMGRNLNVNEANPKPARTGGGGGGDRGGDRRGPRMGGGGGGGRRGGW